MINNTTLVGRLTKDIELRYTGSNLAYANFTLAVDRNFKNAQGEREADFVQCVIWRQQAENLANWARKGNLIGITGRIQTRNYENQQGQRVYITEVVAEQFQLLESRNNRQNQGQQQGGYQNQNQGGYNGPQPLPSQPMQEQGPSNNQGGMFGGSPTNITDDDLPF